MCELRCSCDVAIPPPNRSMSFEMSAIVRLREIEDIFAYAKGHEYNV